MSEKKPKAKDEIRTPKPKKKLGLSVPPALRLPHEDLIKPIFDQDQDLKNQRTKVHENIVPSELSSVNQVLLEPSSISLVQIEPSSERTEFQENQAESYYLSPNRLDDEIMPTLPPFEQIVLRRLFRLSYGFKRSVTDPVSYSKLAEKCNLSVSTIKRALQGLESKNKIRIIGDRKHNPNAGNQYEALPNLGLLELSANRPSSNEPKSISTKFSQTSIKDHDDLKNTIDHQSETKRIYQTLTGNAWTKTDQSAYEKISAVTVARIEAVMKAVLDRAKDQPRSLNYFVGEILSAGKGSGAQTKVNRRAIEKIVARLRDLHIGGDFDGFRAHVERECAKEGAIFDLDLFNEIIGVR